MAESVAAGSKWIPFYRRRWFVILCLVTVSPVAWLPLFTGKIYRKVSGEGNWVPVKASSRVIYILLSFWLTAYIAYHYADAQTSFDFKIDAANLQECRQKGIALIREGRDPDQIEDYCALRYSVYAYCKSRKLSAQETRNVVLTVEDADNTPNPAPWEHPTPFLFVTNNGPLLLTKVRYIASNGSIQQGMNVPLQFLSRENKYRAMSMQYIANPSITDRDQAQREYMKQHPDGTSDINSSTSPADRDYYGYYNKVELIAAWGCSP